MKSKLLLLIATFPLSIIIGAPEPTASPEPKTSATSTATPAPAASVSPTATPDPTEDLDRELRDRETNILKLTVEEQLRLRAAQQKAMEEPDVKEALEKRNQAVKEFRQAFRQAMIRIDPGLEPILDRVAVGNNPGF